MCDCKSCQKPQESVGKPEECSAEQVRKCHGDVAEHPCVDRPSGDNPSPQQEA